MAIEIYRKMNDDQLRVLAYDIATGQSGQRGEVFDWLVQWGLSQSGSPMMRWMDSPADENGHAMSNGEAMTDREAQAAMGMATAAEITALEEATGKEADCLFLRMIISHHEGAIPVAEALIERNRARAHRLRASPTYLSLI